MLLSVFTRGSLLNDTLYNLPLYLSMPSAVSSTTSRSKVLLESLKDRHRTRSDEHAGEGERGHVDGQEEGEKARAKVRYEECVREGVWYARWTL
jgi:hypothetical protein